MEKFVEMKKEKSIFSLRRDVEKEAKNYWRIANYTFYELDMSKKIPENFLKKIKNIKYPNVKNLIKKEIKKNKKKYPGNFNWLKSDFLPYLPKREKQIISRLDQIHNKKFPAKFVKLYFTSIGLGYYGKEKEGFWINISGSYKDKDSLVELIIHELMHLYFGIYYRKICFKEGLTLQETEDIKEAFTALINEEFKGIIRTKDKGYKIHEKLRENILKQWKKSKDFKKILLSTIKFYKQKK